MNLFAVLRDQKSALIEAIGLTSFSREELASACGGTEGVSEIEQARRFFVRARQVRTGLAQTASAGRWAHCKLTSRAGMAGAVSRWLGSVEDLSLIAQRLLQVQIENAPALDVIARYDSKAYAHEMTDRDHRVLAERLTSCRGQSRTVRLPRTAIRRVVRRLTLVEAQAKMCHSVKQERTEVLWLNYAPRGLQVRGTMPNFEEVVANEETHVNTPGNTRRRVATRGSVAIGGATLPFSF